MNPNVQLSEALGLVATIDPANVTDSYSDYVDMSKFEQVIGILLTGDMSAHTIDFTAYGYSDASASDATVIKEITQWAAHATTSDNSQAIINVRNEDLRAKSTTAELRYVRFRIVSASQTGYSACVVLAGNGERYGMASKENLSSVQEVEDDRS